MNIEIGPEWFLRATLIVCMVVIALRCLRWLVDAWRDYRREWRYAEDRRAEDARLERMRLDELAELRAWRDSQEEQRHRPQPISQEEMDSIIRASEVACAHCGVRVAGEAHRSWSLEGRTVLVHLVCEEPFLLSQLGGDDEGEGDAARSAA